MNHSPLQLRPLRLEDEVSFKRAVAAFAKENPSWEFAFFFDPNEPFATYVSRLENWSQGIATPPCFSNYVPSSYYVGVVDGVIVGRLSFRHHLNDFLKQYGGHIGYGVIPDERRKGYAKAMLRQALPICAAQGLHRIMISCDTDNEASRKVIESCGGVFDSVTNLPDLKIQKLLYWMNIPR